MALKNDPGARAPGVSGPLSDAVGRLVGLALARGATADDVSRALGNEPASAAETCPECGALLHVQEGCVKCPCGYSKC
jgi:hypothetical protein